MNYDVLITGAGLSGLAAGIRLAHFGQKVLIVEAHSRCGGLNSYYHKKGVCIDVGLHAMTNYITKGTRGKPLTKLLRQLRIPYDTLALAPQRESRIVFPDAALAFSNDPAVLRASVADLFPDQLAGFDALSDHIAGFDSLSLSPPELSGRGELARFLSNPMLCDMLLTPLMYYGNPAEDDMDFAQLAILWESIYQSGFARPAGGMKHVVELLRDRFLACGGELRLGARVDRLVADGQRVNAVVLADGETIPADTVLSSAGYVETLRLCPDQPDDALSGHVGRLSFVELVIALDTPPASLGFDSSIVFFNRSDRFTYKRPEGAVDPGSGVVCVPDNFDYPASPADARPSGCHMLRVTMKASYPVWHDPVGTDHPARADQPVRALYRRMKADAESTILGAITDDVPALQEHIIFTDLFTPLTIKRFTGHEGGAVYGSPHKQRDGRTPYENLFLCGTDQGFLGIVGAMLSGISMANKYCLQ